MLCAHVCACMCVPEVVRLYALYPCMDEFKYVHSLYGARTTPRTLPSIVCVAAGVPHTVGSSNCERCCVIVWCWRRRLCCRHYER